MELIVGSKIKYVFPHSSNNARYFVGIIEFVGETFFTARDINKVLLKISFKNFDKVELIDELDNAKLINSYPI